MRLITSAAATFFLTALSLPAALAPGTIEKMKADASGVVPIEIIGAEVAEAGAPKREVLYEAAVTGVNRTKAGLMKDTVQMRISAKPIKQLGEKIGIEPNKKLELGDHPACIARSTHGRGHRVGSDDVDAETSTVAGELWEETFGEIANEVLRDGQGGRRKGRNQNRQGSRYGQPQK